MILKTKTEIPGLNTYKKSHVLQFIDFCKTILNTTADNWCRIDINSNENTYEYNIEEFENCWSPKEPLVSFLILVTEGNNGNSICWIKSSNRNNYISVTSENRVFADETIIRIVDFFAKYNYVPATSSEEDDDVEDVNATSTDGPPPISKVIIVESSETELRKEKQERRAHIITLVSTIGGAIVGGLAGAFFTYLFMK